MTKHIALVGASAVLLAACSSGPSPTPTTTSSGSCTPGVAFNPADFHPCWLAANVNAVGTPVYGGTLQIEGYAEEDTPAEFDPQIAGAWTVANAIARQLVTYPASSNPVIAETIVPDAATAMPTVSADGLTYTFHIKNGIMWNTPTPRQVTSQDFKRGIERNCDPTIAPNGEDVYYGPTIAGMESFCTTFEAMDPTSSAAARAAYMNGNDIAGIQTPDSSTIVFTLDQPATDFLNMLALSAGSAAPVEDLSYVPLTPGIPQYSDGPYEVDVSKYDPGQAEIDLDRNPTWTQSTDTIRHDYVKSIVIKDDLSGASAPEQVQDHLTTGAADLEWNTNVPAEDIGNLTTPAWNPQYGAFPEPGNTAPFLRFNVLSPNNSGALANVKVRQALEYAIDKVAIDNIFGGAGLNEPLSQVIAPGADGYVPFNDYPTPGNRGAPAKCKTLLRQAGVMSLTLKDMYIAYKPLPVEVFREVQSDLGKCGVTVVGVPVLTDFYGPSGVAGSATELKLGKWDITTTGWVPDWFGPANGRAILPALFDGQFGIPGYGDLGGYDDPEVDALVEVAETAPTSSQAATDWHQADERVMADAAFIPFQTELIALFRSSRVHNAIYRLDQSPGYDVTQIWLSPP